MQEKLRIRILDSNELVPDLRESVRALCNRAYGTELRHLFATFTETTHVLGYVGSTLASHAMWVTRLLHLVDGPLLRTAYVEMVATEPRFQRRGSATIVMQRLARAITNYDLGALCPAEPEVYERLGWIFWRGPLFIRTQESLFPTPEERVMILRLPKTPPLDLDRPLSAEWRDGELW